MLHEEAEADDGPLGLLLGNGRQSLVGAVVITSSNLIVRQSLLQIGRKGVHHRLGGGGITGLARLDDGKVQR